MINILTSLYNLFMLNQKGYRKKSSKFIKFPECIYTFLPITILENRVYQPFLNSSISCKKLWASSIAVCSGVLFIKLLTHFLCIFSNVRFL